MSESGEVPKSLKRVGFFCLCNSRFLISSYILLSMVCIWCSGDRHQSCVDIIFLVWFYMWFVFNNDINKLYSLWHKDPCFFVGIAYKVELVITLWSVTDGVCTKTNYNYNIQRKIVFPVHCALPTVVYIPPNSIVHLF